MTTIPSPWSGNSLFISMYVVLTNEICMYLISLIARRSSITWLDYQAL